MTPQEQELVSEELRKSKNYKTIARRLGLTVGEVRKFDIVEQGTFRSSEDGLGREELRKYIVATKHVDHPWNQEDPAIVEAKKAYDDGLVEVCQGRDGFNIILYAIPRKERDTREDRVYFARNFNFE